MCNDSGSTQFIQVSEAELTSEKQEAVLAFLQKSNRRRCHVSVIDKTPPNHS